MSKEATNNTVKLTVLDIMVLDPVNHHNLYSLSSGFKLLTPSATSEYLVNEVCLILDCFGLNSF